MNSENNLIKKQEVTNMENLWFSTCEVAEYLGISNTELEQKIKTFVEGVHFKLDHEKESENQISWRIDLIEEILCMEASPLEKEALRNVINNKITCKK